MNKKFIYKIIFWIGILVIFSVFLIKFKKFNYLILILTGYGLSFIATLLLAKEEKILIKLNNKK